MLPLIIGPMAAEDVRHFDHGAGSESVGQLVNGGLDRLAHLLGQVRIKGGGRRRGVAQDILDYPQINASLQQMSGVRMALMPS
jgi:hypothetical protein